MRSILRNSIRKLTTAFFESNIYKTIKLTPAYSGAGTSYINAISESVAKQVINGLRTTPNQDSNEREKDISILSYNIFVRPPFIHNNGNDFKEERLTEFLARSAPYDVICLQELFGALSNKRDDFIAKAQENGFLYYTTSPIPRNFSSQIVDGGLLIISRYPIEMSEFCPFPRGIGVDYIVQKGALYAKVKIGNSKLHLFTVHTQATYDKTLKYFNKRTEQILAFQNFIKTKLAKYEYQEGDTVLLTGDFNVNARDQRKIQLDQLSDSISEYQALINGISDSYNDQVEDLIHQTFNEHPITFGDYYLCSKNEKKPVDTTLTKEKDFCASECLDYIFSYKPNLSSMLKENSRTHIKSENLKIVDKSAQIEKFKVENNEFSQLSDHYGVKVVLRHTKETANSTTLKESLKMENTNVNLEYL